MTGESGGTLALLAAVFASAVLAGLMVITGSVLLVDALRSGGDPNLELRFYLLFGGTIAGVFLAACAAWILLGPIGSTYRRGGLAMVCAFATVLVMLICIPINEALGRTGLLLLLASSGAGAALLARRARRLGAGA